MATMISEVYDAFRSVGVPEDKARAAAEALSEDQIATKSDITRLERVTTGEIAKIRQETAADIAKLEKEIVVIKWMLGLVIVAVVIPLVKPFFA
jgi:hypothetical protein